jgi:hypothetical protein
VPSLLYGATKLYPANPPSTDVVLDNILPNAFNRSPSSKGLSNASPLVRYISMVSLSAAFQKYGRVRQAFRKVILALESIEASNTEEMTVKPSDNWRKGLETIREGLRRRVPEIQTLVNLFNQAATGTKSATMDEQEYAAQTQMIQDTAFRLIRYYQEYVPETLMESNIDPGNFIPSDILAVKPGTMIHLLNLFLNMPDFNWTSKSCKLSLFYFILIHSLLTSS